jgi:hypothetical protein
MLATRLQKKTLQMIDEVNTIIEENPVDKITLRQIWYRLISKLILESGDSNYQRLSKNVVKGRKAGLIPIDKIIDTHRKIELREYWHITPEKFFNHKTSYDSLKEYLTGYLVHKWHKQPEFIEIWSEKEALSTLFEPIALKYGVSFVVCRGFASYTILLEACKRINKECKERKLDKATILYFGDYDPSGKRIAEVIQKELDNLETSVSFIEIALTSEQIIQYNLPLIPLKKRDKNYNWFMQEYGEFGEKGCELDALEPLVFQNLVDQSILKHFNQEIYRQVEAERQEEISKMVAEAEKLLSKMGVES